MPPRCDERLQHLPVLRRLDSDQREVEVTIELVDAGDGAQPDGMLHALLLVDEPGIAS
jgi:hypothetical protein